MTDQTPEQLAEQLRTLRRKMIVVATHQPTTEQLAAGKAADKTMADRIHKLRPGVPLHHAFQTLDTLRTIQTMDRAGNPDREQRIPLDHLTSDQLDQLYDDLDRYEALQGEMNERAIDLTIRAERAEAERDHLAAAASPADTAVRAVQLMQETERKRYAMGKALHESRTTNQRLNLRAQQLDSELATYRKAVAQWQIGEQSTYVPLHTIAAIAKAAGLNVPNDRYEMHYQRLEHTEAERDGAYRDRAHLLGHFAALYPSHGGYTDPNAPDWPVLIVETPAGQMSWHIAERDLDLFEHVRPTGENDRGWDGHSTDEKHERLRALTAVRAGCQDPIECGHEAALGHAEAAIARGESLRDKWLSWGVGNMHHDAGSMLAKHLDGGGLGPEETDTSTSSRPRTTPNNPAAPLSRADEDDALCTCGCSKRDHKPWCHGCGAECEYEPDTSPGPEPDPQPVSDEFLQQVADAKVREDVSDAYEDMLRRVEACGPKPEPKTIPAGVPAWIANGIHDLRFHNTAETDFDYMIAAGAPVEYARRHAETGINTPGCDCGHDGMGAAWHADTCHWNCANFAEEKEAAAYTRAVMTPPTAEVCAAIRAELESGTLPRRKIRMPSEPAPAPAATEATAAPATITDPAWLREQYAQAIAADDGHPWNTLATDTQNGYLDNADAVLAVRDRDRTRLAVELAQTRSDRDWWKNEAKRPEEVEARQQRDQLAATLREVLDAFQPMHAAVEQLRGQAVENPVYPYYFSRWRSIADQAQERPGV